MNEKQASKWLVKPNYQTFSILNEEIALIKMRKTTVKLNKPIYIGFTVLELSKYLIYDYYYNCFKRYYGKNLTLAYTDTDSFIFEIKTEDLYHDLSTIFKNYMDFSNYPSDHIYFDESKKNKIGMIKDEMCSEIINEFIGLKSKLYSIDYGDSKEENKAKGLQKSILKRYINHQHYKEVLKHNKILNVTNRRISSKNHEIQTMKVKKMIFTPFDDKKFILDDGISCLPFGHFLITQNFD